MGRDSLVYRPFQKTQVTRSKTYLLQGAVNPCTDAFPFPHSSAPSLTHPPTSSISPLTGLVSRGAVVQGPCPGPALLPDFSPRLLHRPLDGCFIALLVGMGGGREKGNLGSESFLIPGRKAPLSLVTMPPPAEVFPDSLSITKVTKSLL